MMTKSSKDQGIQADLFKPLLVDIISMSHELVLLEKAIDWKRFEEVLAPAYCKDNGRPSIPVRMMAGLTFLKYMNDLSDQEVLDRWCENPYWQYFCGGIHFEHTPPTDQATMSRWRARAGEKGATEMIKEILAAAVRNKVAKKGDFARVNVDTTVQEKNIRFPTDARTLDRARERVVCIGEKLNVMFAAIGFNLKKLMKGLKRLFFCLRTEIQSFGDFICTVVKILSAQINFNRVLAATTLCG